MDLEKFTERSRGFLQAAQTLALRSGHQRLTPEHLLKVLLDDKDGLAAGLLRNSGADPARALAATEKALDKQPKVEGSGAGQVYMAPELARVLDQAEKLAEKAGDGFVTAERLLLALALDQRRRHRPDPQRRRRHRAGPQCRDQRGAQGPHRAKRERRGQL